MGRDTTFPRKGSISAIDSTSSPKSSIRILDGAGVVEGFFQKQVSGFYGFLRTQPLFMLLGMVFIVISFGRHLMIPYFEAILLLI